MVQKNNTLKDKRDEKKLLFVNKSEKIGEKINLNIDLPNLKKIIKNEKEYIEREISLEKTIKKINKELI